MSDLLKVSQEKLEDVNEIKKRLSSDLNIFRNIYFDYLVITFYADFEKELNKLITDKLSENIFSKKYADFISLKYKQLHGGLNHENFKALVSTVFGKNIDTSTKEWQIYCAFIKFRNSISHNDNYEIAKNTLLSNISDIDEVLKILICYLEILRT